MSIRDGLAGHSMMLTVAIGSTRSMNFFNVSRNETQLTAAVGLSVPLIADAVRWTGAATVLISEVAFFVASSSRTACAVVTSEASNWSVGVSWFIHASE